MFKSCRASSGGLLKPCPTQRPNDYSDEQLVADYPRLLTTEIQVNTAGSGDWGCWLVAGGWWLSALMLNYYLLIVAATNASIARAQWQHCQSNTKGLTIRTQLVFHS